MSASTQTVDERLKLVIRSFYEAASLAREIGQKEDQKKNLLMIQDQLQRDRLIPNNSNSERLSESITEIQQALRSSQTKLKESEAKAVRLLQETIQERLKDAFDDAMKRRSENERLLSDKMQTIENSYKTEFQRVREQISAVKRSALTNEEANKMLEKAASVNKAQILETHNHDLTELREQCKKAYRDLNAKVDKNKLAEAVSDAVADRIKDKISTEMTTKVQGLVGSLITQNNANNTITENITAMIKSQVEEVLSNPGTYEKLVTGSERFTNIKSRINSIESLVKELGPIQKHASESIENKMSDLAKKMTALNKVAETLLRNTSRGPGNGTSAGESEILKAMSQRIEELTTDLKVTKAQLKSSEALLDVRWRELERMLESQSATDEGEQSRKRQRTDDGAPITEKVVDKELTKKLELVEQKYAHTLDFVQQFRTTILNPHFPQRLQQAIASIESTLHNHELFIAHLVDPVAASKSQPITIPADANVDSSTSNTQLLSPAMIPAIQNLVKQSVEYSTKPLLERIRALEEELKKK